MESLRTMLLKQYKAIGGCNINQMEEQFSIISCTYEEGCILLGFDQIYQLIPTCIICGCFINFACHLPSNLIFLVISTQDSSIVDRIETTLLSFYLRANTSQIRSYLRSPRFFLNTCPYFTIPENQLCFVAPCQKKEYHQSNIYSLIFKKV